jgi:translation elongation factor EF-4
VDQHRIKLEMILPLSEIVTNFFDDLKSMTSGYGSFDYEDAGYQVRAFSFLFAISA